MKWAPLSLPALSRATIAVVGVGLAFSIQMWVDPLARHVPFILVYPVVFLCAWFLGRQAALIATLLGASGAAFWFMEPVHQALIENPAARGRLLTFVIVCLGMTQVLHKSRQYYLQLKLSEERFQFATTVARIGTWEWDLASNRIYGSSVLQNLFGLASAQSALTPDHVFARIHPEDQEYVRQRISDAVVRRELYQAEFRILTEEGLTRWLLGKGRCVYDSKGTPLHIIGTNIDTTELKNAERALRDSANQYRALTSAVPVGIFRTDRDGNCIYANERWSDISGLPPERLSGRGWLNAIHDSDRDYIVELWKTTTAQGLNFMAEYRMERANGSLTWVSTQAVPELREGGYICGYVGAVTDITERKHYEESLRLKATTDELTGLANRAAAVERLEVELAFARQHTSCVALMFIDLDNFKQVNDTLGHQAGDELLVKTSRRLAKAIGAEGLVARFAGDEFLIILPRLRRIADAEEMAQRVVESFAKVFRIAGNSEAFVTCSVGLAVFPEDGTDSEALLRHADLALYRAKETGRNNYQFFLEAMNHELHERRRMELHLRYAMERQELAVFYQPVFQCDTGALVGFEALLRWRNAELGQVSPERFISLAEETGLIEKIDAWVLDVACHQLKEWQSVTHSPLTLAVNISPAQIHAGALPDTVTTCLTQSGLASDFLELELTERSIIPDDLATESGLQQLHESGVRFSVDDFGTGYSNLSYFQRLPLHSLKLDKSFLKGVPKHESNTVLARTIIAMSHNLGLSVIAEGVENKDQWDFLQQEQCDFVQGFYFGRPMSVTSVNGWLAQQSEAASRD